MMDKATWEDIERAARNDPFLHMAVTMVRRGDCSREEALIIVALALSTSRAELMQKELERLMRTPAAPMLLP